MENSLQEYFLCGSNHVLKLPRIQSYPWKVKNENKNLGYKLKESWEVFGVFDRHLIGISSYILQVQSNHPKTMQRKWVVLLFTLTYLPDSLKKRGGSQNLHKSDQCYKTDPICNRQRNAGAINSLHTASSFKCFIPPSQASRAPD